MNPDDKKLYLDFLEAINAMNEFIYNYQTIIENNLPFGDLKEEYSMERTFKINMDQRKNQKTENLNLPLEKTIILALTSEKDYAFFHTKFVKEISANNRFEKLDFLF